MVMNSTLKLGAISFSIFVFGVLKISICAMPQNEFLQQYCIDCHGQEKQKGDRRFDGLGKSDLEISDLEAWQEILDMLNLGDMPPEDEKQPTVAERAAMIESTPLEDV